jgi:hypothetical protein
MDESQADAAAEAILTQARAERTWRRRPKRSVPLAPFTSRERGLMAVLGVTGMVAGLIGFYFGGNAVGGAIGGAIWGATGGLAMAPLVIWLRRVLTVRSTERSPATRVSDG